MGLQLHELHYNLGHVLHQQGDLPGAIAAFRQSIALNPADDSAHHSLAIVLEAQGQEGVAIEYYQQAIALNSDHAMTYNNLGCLLLRQGNTDWAIQVYQQGLKVQPDLAILHNNLGQALFEQDLEQGIVAFQRAIALQPDLLTAHHNLGKAFHRQGDYTAAIACFQSVLRLQPDYPQVWGDCGVAWISQGEFKSALSCFRRAIDSHREYIQAYCAGAEQPEKADKFTQARRMGARFLQALQQVDDARAQRYLAQTYQHWGDALVHYNGDQVKQYQEAEFYYQQATRLQPHSLKFRLKLTHCRKQQQSFNPVKTANSPCLGLNCKPCLKRIEQSFALTHLGKGVYFCPPTANGIRQTVTTSMPRFTARILQGRVWSAPQQNEWLVCNAIAVLSSDNQLLSSLSRDYPGQLPGCQYPDAAQHLYLRQTALPPLQQIEGKVAVLVGLSGHNYYHWLVDVLPRIEILRHSVDLDQMDWFLINQPRQPFQQETLQQLGIPLDKVLVSDRHPHIQASELIVPAFAGDLGWLESWALEFLRREFLPLAAPTCSFHPTFPTKIYISRANATYRRVLNEAAVIEQLEQRGFVVVATETLSFAEQIALFVHAQVVVAPHGGGLANLIFCDRGTTVIELTSTNYVRHYYWVMSRLLGLNFYLIKNQGLPCEPIRQLIYPDPLAEDIWVNLEALSAGLKQIGL